VLGIHIKNYSRSKYSFLACESQEKPMLNLKFYAFFNEMKISLKDLVFWAFCVAELGIILRPIIIHSNKKAPKRMP
jgi:hypothetical protein